MVSATSTSTEADRFMQGLARRNPGQPLFHQAVQEVARDVMPFVLENPVYRQAQILERLTETRALLSPASKCWLVLVRGIDHPMVAIDR